MTIIKLEAPLILTEPRLMLGQIVLSRAGMKGGRILLLLQSILCRSPIISTNLGRDMTPHEVVEGEAVEQSGRREAIRQQQQYVSMHGSNIDWKKSVCDTHWITTSYPLIDFRSRRA
jgi:hypothetical protein